MHDTGYMVQEEALTLYPDTSTLKLIFQDLTPFFIVAVAGIDHVGIGTDFDGGGELTDCYDVSEVGVITRELVKRGYTGLQIEKIWGGNLMRVFREVEDAAGT